MLLPVLTLLLVTLSLHLHTATSLNIDGQSPTVVRSGLNTNDIGFGWTLIQHQFTDGRKIALVSAPKFMQEGGVYSCSYDNQATCQLQSQFQNRNISGGSLFTRPLSTFYDGQLMGYSLKSDGDNVVACAPQYVHKRFRIDLGTTTYFRGAPNGRCIILNSDLNTTAQLYSERLMNAELQLAGLDIELLQVNGEKGILVANTFAGKSPHAGQVILSGVLPDTISNKGASPITQAPLDAYLGFHVEKGQFTTLQDAQVAVSAPRSNNHFGKVDIMAINPIRTILTLDGEEADGYFGYDFAVLDLGQGGYNSLAVGCPLCARERGRVYIYAHTGDGDTTNPFIQKTALEAPGLGRGRFGSAVENIGDIDLDGLSDVAVSAPYEGMGVVYIYRGSESGLVSHDYQTIPATVGSSAFGYSLSGGLDIDGNSYPDVTVGDLSGEQVTTLRASPLVNVSLVLKHKDVLDLLGDTDRLCPLEGVTLHCFNVTPCFHYETIRGDVPRFALSYSLSVDEQLSRVVVYSSHTDGVGPMIGERAVISGVLTIPSPSTETCAETVTFALSSNVADSRSIPVRLTVDDAPTLLALEPEQSLAQFGNPLHPTLLKYVKGNTPALLTLEQHIRSDVDCSSGTDPETCEGNFSLTITDNIISGLTQLDNGRIIIGSSNEFGFEIIVTNIADDLSINPTLIILHPTLVVWSRSEPVISCNSRSDVSSNTSSIECRLKNPMPSQETTTLKVYFAFNDTRSLQAQLELMFFVRDEVSEEASDIVTRTLELEAVSDYGLFARASETEYRAFRSAIIAPNPSTLSLDQIGPQIPLRILVQNARNSTQGTTFPQSTLFVYIPVEETSGKPLLIPTDVVSNGFGNVNCSHYGAIPGGLPSVQQPVEFSSPWDGTPLASAECERNGTYRCGVIICTVYDLQPLPEPQREITIFSRLYSPTISEGTRMVKIFSNIISDTDLPRLGNNSMTSASESFTLSPGAREVQRECIKYWIVVVSVVVAIFVLLIIVAILAMCGLFKRWYKQSKEDCNGVEHTDSEYSYHRRTIPPIPGLTNGETISLPPPPPPIFQSEFVLKGDKEEEADAELQEELKAMARHKSPTPTDSLAIGSGEETEL